MNGAARNKNEMYDILTKSMWNLQCNYCSFSTIQDVMCVLYSLCTKTLTFWS